MLRILMVAFLLTLILNCETLLADSEKISVAELVTIASNYELCLEEVEMLEEKSSILSNAANVCADKYEEQRVLIKWHWAGHILGVAIIILLAL